MDGVREFLEQVLEQGLAEGNLRAIFHVIIGRKISRTDGTPLSNGASWRQLSELLRTLRWEKDQVRELGLDPDALPPRDRQRYWYAAIQAAHVESPQARAEGDRFADQASKIGFKVGPAPS